MSWPKLIGTAMTAGTLAFAAGLVGGSLLASGLVDGVLPDVGPIRSVLGAAKREAERARIEEELEREEAIRREAEDALRAEGGEDGGGDGDGGGEDAIGSPTDKPKPPPKPGPSPKKVPAPSTGSPHTGGCASGGMRGAPADGTWVEIVGVSTEDAFYADRSSYLGTKGVASGLSTSGDCYFSGAIARELGDSPYFYQVAVKATDAPRTAAASTSSSSCPSGALRSVSAGDSVVILAVHPDDAFHPSATTLVGQSGTAVAPDLTEGCWWGGTIRTAGTERYFYKVALGAGSGTRVAGDACPPGAVTSVSSGQHLTIAAIHSEDAYYDSRSSMMGQIGTNGGLDRTEGCWFGGPFRQDNGEERYFYKAAFTVAGGPPAAGSGCPAGALSSASSGQRVVVLKVHPDDAYHSSRGRYEGQAGTVVDVQLQSDSRCYFSGTVKLDNGDEPYFYMAALGRR